MPRLRNRPNEKPLLLFVVTEDWYFYSHRRPMIKAAQECGFDVGVITNVDRHRKEIEALGVKVIPFSFERRSLNPKTAWKQIRALKKIYLLEQPEIVHHIAMKPILFGSIAARKAKVPCIVNAFAGLGYVFHARTPLAVLLKILLWLPFFFLLRQPNSWLLLQNEDDRKALKDMELILDRRTRVIRGSGVDLNEFKDQPMNPPAPDFVCIYAGRMIDLKGLPTLKEAFELLRIKSPRIRLRLYGKPDSANPGSWSEQEIKDWVANSDNVSFEGFAENMADIWAQAHLAVQASYGGEGVPKSLLEAAACGRPIVATNVPGCREVVADGRNGILVPSRDAHGLAWAIETLFDDWELCKRMGAESRKLVEEDMSALRVKMQTVEFYRECMEHRD